MTKTKMTKDSFSKTDLASIFYLIRKEGNKPLSKLQLLQYFPLNGIHHLISSDILVLYNVEESVPRYVFNDGFLNG